MDFYTRNCRIQNNNSTGKPWRSFSIFSWKQKRLPCDQTALTNDVAEVILQHMFFKEIFWMKYRSQHNMRFVTRLIIITTVVCRIYRIESVEQSGRHAQEPVRLVANPVRFTKRSAIPLPPGSPQKPWKICTTQWRRSKESMCTTWWATQASASTTTRPTTSTSTWREFPTYSLWRTMGRRLVLVQTWLWRIWLMCLHERVRRTGSNIWVPWPDFCCGPRNHLFEMWVLFFHASVMSQLDAYYFVTFAICSGWFVGRKYVDEKPS